MKFNHLVVLALLSAIPFIAYLSFPTLLGADSFYFYSFTCGYENIPEISIPILSRIFFELMPCNLFAFKAIFFVAIFISSIIISKTGELFDKENGWMAGALAFIAISFIHGFVQIEDDLLGFPFLFAANYFFLKGEKNKSNREKVVGVTLVLLTGALLWKGALLYLVVYSFFSVFLLILFYAVLFYIGFGAMNGIIGNEKVQENLNGFLISLMGAKTIGFGQGIGLLGLYVLVKRVWLALPFFVATLLNQKWAVHLSLFLGLGLMFLVTDLNNFRLRKQIVFKESWANTHFLKIFLVLAFVSTIALSVGLLFQYPNSSQLEASQFAVEQAEGELIDNDWSYGYYIIFYGGDTNTFGGGWPNYTESFNDKILLTENPEPIPNCNLLRVWQEAGFYGADIKVYNCDN